MRVLGAGMKSQMTAQRPGTARTLGELRTGGFNIVTRRTEEQDSSSLQEPQEAGFATARAPVYIRSYGEEVGDAARRLLTPP